MRKTTVALAMALSIMVVMAAGSAQAIVFHETCGNHEFNVDIVGVTSHGSFAGAGMMTAPGGDMAEASLFFNKAWNELVIISEPTDALFGVTFAGSKSMVNMMLTSGGTATGCSIVVGPAPAGALAAPAAASAAK